MLDVLPILGNLMGTPRFITSGQIRDAPKFEKSHHLRAGLPLTAPRTQGQPTPAKARERTMTPRKEEEGRTAPRLAPERLDHAEEIASENLLHA